jgi:hypothetical protein
MTRGRYSQKLNPSMSDGWADQQTGGYIHGDGKDEGYPNGYPNFDSTRPVWSQTITSTTTCRR